MKLIAISAAIAGLSLGQAWANESKLSDKEMDGVAAGTYVSKPQNTATRTVQRGYKNQNAIADDRAQVGQQRGAFNQQNVGENNTNQRAIGLANTQQSGSDNFGQSGVVNVGANRSFNNTLSRDAAPRGAYVGAHAAGQKAGAGAKTY
jgi:hypothetical protein